MKKLINRIKKAAKNKRNGLQLPNIVYSNAMTEKELSNSHIEDNVVAKCLDLILYELGFISGEKVVIGDHHNYKHIRGYYIECYKDKEYLFKLGFVYSDSFSRTPKLIVTYPHSIIQKTYEIDYEPVKNQPKITLYLTTSEHKYSSGTKYLRNYNWEDAEYIISKGENQFVLKVDKPYDLQNPKEHYYRLNNEEELVNYLSKLEFPIEIEEVYKKICEISLGENISEYPFIHICVTKEGMATDTLDIDEGEWHTFRKTKGDKTVVLYQNGTWEYELSSNDNLENKTTVFSMTCEKDGISCNIQAKTDSELDDYTKTLVGYDISTARSEVENTRKLVLKMTNQKDKNQM